VNRDSVSPVPGKPFTCPHCGEESIARKQTVMDGWRTAGQIVVCALCGTEVGNPDAAAKAEARQQDKRMKDAEALLGATLGERKTLTRDGTERFCKNCRHFLIHPFQCRCLYWSRPVEPMSDCAKFEERSGPGKT
jgi:predicted RNA-binding Zn-ribbon protein involved in translation (DUF1610 family)